MKKTLIIFFTFLFTLTSFSVVAKEYIMQCAYNTYKLVDSPMDKNLYLRIDGSWKKTCYGKNSTFVHNGDGAVCYTKVKDETERCNGMLCEIDQTDVYDFLLYTTTKKFLNPKDGKTETRYCKKLK